MRAVTKLDHAGALDFGSTAPFRLQNYQLCLLSGTDYYYPPTLIAFSHNPMSHVAV